MPEPLRVANRADERLDGRRARGERTRRAILAKAVDIASTEGLEGLSIGRLATEVEISKSGLFAHFGSKEELQLATVRAASEIFADTVVRPTADLEPGLARLSALTRSWLEYLRGSCFSGGCFFSHAYHEFDSRPGAVRDEIAAQKRKWGQAFVHHACIGKERGELRSNIDPAQLAFELDAAGELANSLFQLHGDEDAFDRAATAMRERLRSAATQTGCQALAALG